MAQEAPGAPLAKAMAARFGGSAGADDVPAVRILRRRAVDTLTDALHQLSRRGLAPKSAKPSKSCDEASPTDARDEASPTDDSIEMPMLQGGHGGGQTASVPVVLSGVRDGGEPSAE